MQTLRFKQDRDSFRLIAGKSIPQAGERVYVEGFGEALVNIASEEVIDLVFDETVSGCFAFKIESECNREGAYDNLEVACPPSEEGEGE